MLERIIEEAGVYGLLDHACPDFEDESGIAEHIVGLFYNAGMDELGDYWHGNLIIHGVE